MNQTPSRSFEPDRPSGLPPGPRRDALDAIIRAVTQRAYWHAGARIEQFVAGATLEELLALREALEELTARRRSPPRRCRHDSPRNAPP
ncbi:hypothetical protein [Streptomyces longispororuber]|uniref:hypothetical protein n=1 Tax=Streptomyces longispororuber TaxID=68230 RepID=UPI00210CF9E3|nr:hypothetical protein [Streptomyces longispororuber]MCQ4205608.1 hypothetical protein [Streptomyces longispororuber]